MVKNNVIFGGELDGLKKEYEGYTRYGLLDEIKKLKDRLEEKKKTSELVERRAKPVDINVKEIWEKVRENSEKRKNCKKHDFEMVKPGKWVCKNCGCIEPTEFVIGYEQGLGHGRM